MKSSFLDKLDPVARRFVVFVGVLFFIVLNAWLVWPHFKDWGRFKGRLNTAHENLAKFQNTVAEKKSYEDKVKELESEGSAVPQEDQSTEFMRTIQSQAALSSVNILGSSPPVTRTNQFFMEQSRSISVQATEDQLVDFLYNLGAGNSLIRVRDLSLRPDTARQALGANVKLVASYQKKPASPAPAPSAKPAKDAKPAPPKK